MYCRRLMMSAVLTMFLACAAGAAMIDDFDYVKPGSFQFKDDAGSTIQASARPDDADRGRALAVEYNIKPKGWAGWGIAFDGLNISDDSTLSFMIKGVAGGEKFEISLKDKTGAEKKIETAAYMDVTKEWQYVKIPLSTFSGVDLKAIDAFTIGFGENSGKGGIFVDDIQFEKAGSAAPNTKQQADSSKDVEAGVQVTRSNKVLLDGFERANPYDLYVILQGDDSTMQLSSSRLSHDGDYAMEMDYTLATSLTWGSYAVAHWQNKRTPLDWTGVQQLKIWVKGDTSDNIFRFTIFDDDGEAWVYDDPEVLKSSKWSQITMPISDFTLSTLGKKGNGIFDYKKIKGYEIGVMSKNNTTVSGTIYVDQLYLVGKGMSVVWAAPPNVYESLRIAMPAIGNVDLSGLLYTEWLNTPETNQQVNHYVKLTSNAKVGDFSARFDFQTQTQEFAQAANEMLLQTDGNIKRTYIQTYNPSVESGLIQVSGNNVFPWMSNFTVGNVQVNYNKYTFSLPPLSSGGGWKGASAEGDMGLFNYNAFYIKQSYDGNISGTRITCYQPTWKAAATVVNSYESAQLQGSTASNGVLTPDDNVQISPVLRDTIYFGEMSWWLPDKTVQAEVNAGGDAYHQYANTVSSFSFVTPLDNPIYNQALNPPIDQYGRMSRLNIQTDSLLWDGFHTVAEYRYVGENYKPIFRTEPYYFDDVEGNQDGFNFSVTQKLGGVQMSSRYITFNRPSGGGDYRKDFLWDIGYYGFHGIDIAYHGETAFLQYVYSSSRTVVNYANPQQRLMTGQVYMRTQFNPNLIATVSMQRMQWDFYNGDPESSVDIFDAKLEYKLNTNATFIAETKSSVYSQHVAEPVSWPYDDNFSRISFQLTF